MDHMDMAADPRFMLSPQRRRPMRALLRLWWSHDCRRQIAQLGTTDRHPLDEGFVADAMAHQLEEIRNLPEIAR